MRFSMRVVNTAAILPDRSAGGVTSATAELSAWLRRCACSFALNSRVLNEPITCGNAPGVPPARPAFRVPRTTQVGVSLQPPIRRRQLGFGAAMWMSRFTGGICPSRQTSSASVPIAGCRVYASLGALGFEKHH
jgi:hypothetical protein